MTTRTRISTRHAILGVLMQGPAHGYRIKKKFAPFIARDGMNDGQLYPVLTQLEEDNLVRKETVRQQKSPNKNLYHITERGREEFLDWLAGSDDEIDPVKYDFFMQYRFLLKCNFFEYLPRKERIAKLHRQIEIAREKIGEYERIRTEMLQKGLHMYKIRIVEFGIRTQRLKIDWITELLAGERENGRALSGEGRSSRKAKPRPAARESNRNISKRRS